MEFPARTSVVDAGELACAVEAAPREEQAIKELRCRTLGSLKSMVRAYAVGYEWGGVLAAAGEVEGRMVECIVLLPTGSNGVADVERL